MTQNRIRDESQKNFSEFIRECLKEQGDREFILQISLEGAENGEVQTGTGGGTSCTERTIT